MLALLRLDAVYMLALAWLLIGLTFPFLAFWFLYRVARDLRRIADAVEFQTQYPSTAHAAHAVSLEEHREELARRVANSAFGR